MHHFNYKGLHYNGDTVNYHSAKDRVASGKEEAQVHKTQLAETPAAIERS